MESKINEKILRFVELSVLFCKAPKVVIDNASNSNYITNEVTTCNYISGSGSVSTNFINNASAPTPPKNTTRSFRRKV